MRIKYQWSARHSYYLPVASDPHIHGETRFEKAHHLYTPLQAFEEMNLLAPNQEFNILKNLSASYFYS